MATIINYRLLLRGGPATEWLSRDPVLLAREPALDTTTWGMKVGDGQHKWSELDYVWGGEDYNLTIGAVGTGETALASIGGKAPNQQLNLTLPRGPKGDTGATGGTGPSGPAPVITLSGVTTLAPGAMATATISGTAPNYSIAFSIPRGAIGQTGQEGAQGQKGEKGDTGATGGPGPANVLTIGSVAAGLNAAASISGVSPNQQLNLTLPKGDAGERGPEGPPVTLSIGTTTTGAPGSAAGVSLTGTSPNQVLNLTIPRGDPGSAATITSATASTGAAGSPASVTMGGTALARTFAFTIPQGVKGDKGNTGDTGPANVLSIGTVSTLPSGSSATASITGTTPAQQLNLELPEGPRGEQGVAAVITGATVIGLPSGSTPTVTLGGTSLARTFEFSLPAGPQGERGPTGAGLQVNGTVPTADDLPTTGMSDGLAYVTTDTGLLYVWGASGWSEGLQFTGPRGETGPPAATTIDPKPATDLPSSYPEGISIMPVSNDATWPAAYATVETVRFGVNRSYQTIVERTTARSWRRTPDAGDAGWLPWAEWGAKGDTGPATALSVGAVTTGAAGSSASVTISGTAPAQTLAFTIPRGNTGAAATITGATASGLAAGAAPTVTLGGSSSARTFAFGIPAGAKGDTGPANSLAIGTVATLEPGASASATITGTAPSQTLNLSLPQGARGYTGSTGQTGQTGPSNVLSIGTVSTGAEGAAAAATITGTSPAQTLNLTLPRGAKGDTGPANSLTVGTVTTLATGEPATASITGSAPSQTLALGLPKGNTGNPGAPNVLSIGTVTTVAAGTSAAATITGTSPSQVLNLTIPQGPTGLTGNTGPANVLSIGTVTTGAAGSAASANITGTAPNQTLNLTIPRGDQGVVDTTAINTKYDKAGGDITGLVTIAPPENANVTHPGLKISMPTTGQGKAFQATRAGEPTAWASFEFNAGGTAKPGFALGPGGLASRDVNLYRDANGVLRTDAKLIAATPTDTAHVTTKGYVDGGLSGKSDTAHTHAYTSLTGIPTSFAPSTHNHAATEITSGTLDPARVPLATASAQGGISATLFSRLNGAATTATASTLALRDASGRAQFADPALNADAATMGWVTTQLNGKAPSAAGLPTGGTTGQVLAKTSSTDYATAWVSNDPHWYGTAAQYAAIGTKDPNMTYFVS